MSRIYDISLPISAELPTWPGDPLPVIERFSKMEAGEAANVSRMEICVHLGTHVDAPYHFLPDGSTVDQLPLEVLVGPVQVVEIAQDCDLITAQVLRRIPWSTNVRRVLFKTRNSRHWQEQMQHFDEDFVALAREGAELLIEMGVRLVGIDYLSIAPYADPLPTHQVLLENEVIILENVDLSAVPAGEYQLACLPLKIQGAEAAPVRAILMAE